MSAPPGQDDARPRAIVIGSSGGIGSALQHGLERRGFAVTGLARSSAPGKRLWIDITDQRSIEHAAAQLKDHAPFDRILLATGLLHDRNIMPERSIRDLDEAQLLRLCAVNAVGPALVAKHFIPLLPTTGRSMFGALSARVGSIGDNRLGGWFGYRASKAALNMIIKTLAIELGRSRPDAICVGLHPGTVDTRLSLPFQKGVARERLFSPDQSANHLLDVLDRLTPAQSGRCFAWDGAEIIP